MKKIKSFLALALALSMCASFAACGENADSGTIMSILDDKYGEHKDSSAGSYIWHPTGLPFVVKQNSYGDNGNRYFIWFCYNE